MLYYKKNKPETLIKLTKLQKLNRRNRLKDKIKQREYYGIIEGLYDPVKHNGKSIKSVFNHSVKWLFDCME